jgi:quercetin dioxygenase-like cupin family protein
VIGLALELDQLVAIARGIASVTPPWREEATVRWFEQVLVTDEYDVWVIGWPPGTSVGLHDHDGAGAAICVVEGELVESRPARTSAPEWQLRAGQTVTVDRDVVHDVANRGAAAATSVHVYSPPLQAMRFYDG